MEKIRSILFIVFLLFSCADKADIYTTSQHIVLEKSWKFRPGDNEAYASVSFDDSQWDSIEINNAWRNQCYGGYYGYGWYRTKIFLSSALKDSSYFKDSLKIYLGKIGEFDQVYLNGYLIGENNKFVPLNTIDTSIKDTIRYTDIPRMYNLPVNDKRLLWNKYNILAVRVYSPYDYAAGLYSGLPYIAMKSLEDYLLIDKNSFYKVDTLDKIDTNLVIRNVSSKITTQGMLTVRARNVEKESDLLDSNYYISLKPGEKKSIPVTIATTTDRVSCSFLYRDALSKTEIREVDTLPYVLWKD